MESYLLKSGIILLCFYTVYWFLVRHNHYFNFNRFVILSSALVSALLPLITLDLLNVTNNQVATYFQPIIISSFDNTTAFEASVNSYSIYSIVYIIGLLVLSTRSLSGVATLVYLYWRFPKKRYYGFKAVIIDGNQSPFTLFNILFINVSDFNRGKVDELIVHEQAHRDQFHSIDLIILEILTIIHWFNPFIWLFKHDLKSEHEFKADEQVIKRGFNKTRYQHLLLQSNEGIALYLANNFNYSILKKRLKMITSKKSNRKIKFNYVMAPVLLVISATVLFFNFQLNRPESSSLEELPVYVEGNSAMYNTVGSKIKYPLEARKNNIQGTVYVSFTVSKKGKIKEIKSESTKYNLLEEIVVVGYTDNANSQAAGKDLSVLETETERIIALLGDFTPGKKDGKAVSVRMTLPVTFKID